VSVGTTSSGSISGLIHELEAGAALDFGPDPIAASGGTITPVPIPTGRYGRWLARMRDRVIPRLFAEANTAQIELVRMQRVADGRNLLSYTNSEVTQTIDAIVTGPSEEDLQNGFTATTDFRVMVAATDVTLGITETHRVRFDSITYDIMSIKPVPTRPGPVAYIVHIRRSA